jgi:hypothetical protein
MLSFKEVKNCANLLNLIDKEVKEPCEKHNLPSRFCCTTCNKEKSFCIECFYSEHDQTHTICPIAMFESNNNNPTFNVFQEYETQYKEYTKKIDEINNKINEISNIRDINLTFINEIEKSMRNRFQYILNVLFEQRNAIQNILKELLNAIYQLRSICFCKSRYETIIADSVLKEIQKFNTKIENFNKDQCHLTKMSVFQIQNMNMLRESKSFQITFHKVRDLIRDKKTYVLTMKNIFVDFFNILIMFCPLGNISGKPGNSISIFIGIMNSMPENGEIVLHNKIEMVNLKGNQNYVKESQSVYGEKSRYKGWKAFYPINKLETNGFIGNDGEMVFNITVLPNDYVEYFKSIFWFSNKGN